MNRALHNRYLHITNSINHDAEFFNNLFTCKDARKINYSCVFIKKALIVHREYKEASDIIINNQ